MVGISAIYSTCCSAQHVSREVYAMDTKLQAFLLLFHWEQQHNYSDTCTQLLHAGCALQNQLLVDAVGMQASIRQSPESKVPTSSAVNSANSCQPVMLARYCSTGCIFGALPTA